jgi:hypothetical protein
VLLLLVSFWQVGWWIGDFLGQSQMYLILNRGAGMPWSLENLVSPPGIGWLVCTIIVLGFGILQLWQHENFPWLAMIGALNLTLIVSPHTLEYDLTILVVPLFWIGTRFYSLRRSLVLFFILIWFPWYSWLGMLVLGRTTEDWWSIIWQTYPVLLLLCTLAVLVYSVRCAPLQIFTEKVVKE